MPTRDGFGYRGGFRGGRSRSDMNMFSVLSDQDGGVSVVKVIHRIVLCYLVVMKCRN